MVALEERTKALAKEVQALEFEVKDKDKLIMELEDELEVCENTHFIVHCENQLNIRHIKTLKAELQQYKEPVAEFDLDSGEFDDFFTDHLAGGTKKYRVLILEAKDEKEMQCS